MQRDTGVGAMHSSLDARRQSMQQQHVHLQHASGISRPDTTTTADARDQEQQELVQLSLELPITYMPFKFENRRVRIDWRLLHGVDIDKLVRDTDLDTLEQLVTCVTWGDIEAEDTRHLSEGNFVKVFRLAQLLLEYLLYVQENLKYTNSVLDRNRSAAVLHAQSLSTRCRDLYNQLKSCKRELKRVHKTVKTFELMAAAVGGAAAAAQAASAAAAATPTKQEPAAQQQQQQQAPQQVVVQGSVMTAGEMLLQSQLSELTERLTLAVCEAERLRTERQELQYQIRHLHDTLSAKLSGRSTSSSGGGSKAREAAAAAEAATAAAVAAAQQEQQQLFMAELQCAQAQIDELQAQNKELKTQLKQQANAVSSASAAESAAVEIRAKLEEQESELVRLQSELREKEASISVFQTTNATLQQQLDALQRQLTSPEATTPSFVAKQRQQLAAAATAQAGLQSENMKLRQEVLELRLALEAAGRRSSSSSGSKGTAAAQGRQEQDGEEDTLAAAEQLLSGDGEEQPAAADAGASDWKVQEIERLQDENRQLQAKVSSLQEALYGLEAANMRLEKRLAAAQAAGYGSPSPQSSPSAAANSAAAAAAMAAGLSGALGGSGWASVSSSGPAAELTAADLATGAAARPLVAAARVADTDTETAVDGVQLEQSSESVAGDAAAAGTAGSLPDGAAGAAVVKAGAGIGDDAGKVSLGSAGLHSTDGGSSEGVRIAAYRPSRGDTNGGADLQQDAAARSGNTSSTGVISAPASSTGGGGGSSAGGVAAPARGAIDQAAAQQLRNLVAQLQAELTPEQLAAEYAEVCSDWDKPFDLTDDEKGQFRQVVPLEVTGLNDVLCSKPHTAEEVSAAKPGMLSAINRILDSQVASYGIHPGRTGLSNVELLAVMKMLSERREAFEAKLTPDQRNDVEIVRLGLLLHPYHALQSVLGTLPDGPDGKKHLSAVTPALASAVRPPASSLPGPPPPIRLQPRGPSPLASPGGFVAAAAAAGAAPVTLYASSAGATPSPSASARYGVASGTAGAIETDSEDGQSPVKRQELYSTFTYLAAAPGGSNNGVVRPGGSSGGGYVRPPSPLGTEAAREAIAKATASGSFSPMSAALHAKQQLLGSPGSVSTGRSVSPAGLGGSPLGYAPSAGAAAGTAGGGAVTAAASAPSGQGSPVKQQQQQVQNVVRLSPTGVAPPAAVAVQQQQQQQQHKPQQVSAAAALATKQYLGTSFEDSDEF